MNCIIVTQDSLVEESIRKLILESADLYLISAFHTFDKASACMTDYCIDILFFDIQMYDFDSIEFIHTIPESTFVIFIPQPDLFVNINSTVTEKSSNLMMKCFREGIDEARSFLSLSTTEKRNRSTDYFII